MHRLYPGDPNAESFIAASERIAAAARAALAAGAVQVEVRSGRFLTQGRAVGDVMAERLAQACFERRVEYLEFTSVPTRTDLSRWYELLTREAAQIEQAGGMQALLDAAGIASIHAAPGAPETASGEETPDHLLGLADWVGAVDDQPTEEEVAALELRQDESGAELYERLQRFSEAITTDGTVRSSFFRRAARLVEQLPGSQQAVFGRLVIDRLARDGFAERYAGHLTDLALAAVVGLVAEQEGRDPAELGRQVGISAGRHDTLGRLVESIAPRGDADAAPVLEPSVSPGTEGSWLADFPGDPVAGRRLALTALLDVLLSTPRSEQVLAIADNLTAHLQAAVIEGDLGAIEDLATLIAAVESLGVLEVAPASSAPALAASGLAAPASVGGPVIRDAGAALVQARDRAVTSELLTDAAVQAIRSGWHLQPASLAPLGRGVVGALLGAIANSDSDGTSRELAGLVLGVSGDQRSALFEQLGRQRPDVLRHVLPQLARSGDDRVSALLATLALRQEESVLSLVLDSLPANAPGIAASVALRSSSRDLQRRCLDVLEAAGATGRPHLEQLAASSSGRLPWSLRRRLRRLLRQGSGA